MKEKIDSQPIGNSKHYILFNFKKSTNFTYIIKFTFAFLIASILFRMSPYTKIFDMCSFIFSGVMFLTFQNFELQHHKYLGKCLCTPKYTLSQI